MMMMMMDANETETELPPGEASSTLLYQRIGRNKFHGSWRCVALVASITSVFLLNLTVACIAAVWQEYEVLLCTISWICSLTSLVVALVFVVKAEANALTQHNTYGFARAEVVGAVIVATFLAGVAFESALETLKLLTMGYPEEECHEKDERANVLFHIGYCASDAVLRIAIVIMLFTFILPRRKVSIREDATEALMRWRFYHDTLLVHAFTLNIVTGLLYDALQLIIMLLRHSRRSSRVKREKEEEEEDKGPSWPTHPLPPPPPLILLRRVPPGWTTWRRRRSRFATFFCCLFSFGC